MKNRQNQYPNTELRYNRKLMFNNVINVNKSSYRTAEFK